MIHFILLLAISAQVLAGIKLFTESPFHQFVLVHALSTFCFLVWSTKCYKQNNVRFFLLITWFFFPVLGSVLVLFAMPFFRKLGRPEPAAVLELIESIEAQERFFNEMTLKILIQRLEKKRVENLVVKEGDPLVDLLKSGSLEDKKHAVRMLRTIQSREAIKLLKSAQRDSDYDIRYLATITLLDIEKKQLERINSLTVDVKTEPENFELRDELVGAYVDLYESSLLSHKLMTPHLEFAQEHAAISVKLDPGKPKAWLKLGKVFLFRGQALEARSAFDKTVLLDPKNTNVRMWRAKASFAEDEYESIKTECDEIVALTLDYEEIRPQVEFWRKLS